MCQSSAADWLVGLIELVGSAGLVELVGSAGLVQHCALSGKACYACFCFPKKMHFRCFLDLEFQAPQQASLLHMKS